MMPTTDAAQCQSVCPIMPTTEVARTVRFYQALGFAVEVHGDFIMTRRDSIELFLSLNADHDPQCTAACVYVRVNDADALYAQWRAEGIDSVKPLRDTEYGAREFAVIDPDNNMMLYGSLRSRD
jgi:hypothetical protein